MPRVDGDARLHQPPNVAARDALFHHLVQRLEALRLPGHHLHARNGTFLKQAVAIGQRHGERFLHVDMFPRPRRRHADLDVRGAGRADVHDVAQPDHLAVVRRPAHAARQRRHAPRAARIDVRHGDDLRIRQLQVALANDPRR